jgi:hypothetical protein
MIMIRVDRTAGTDHKFPPAARLFLAGPNSGDMRIARKRMTDENGIVLTKRSSALLVDYFDFFQHSTRLELKPAFGEFEFDLFLFYYCNF